MEFLSDLNRSQQYVQYLIDKAEMDELDTFNSYLALTKDKWLSLKLPDALRTRVSELRPLQTEEKRLKHSLWKAITVFGGYMADEMAKQELKDQLRGIRGQLASIEFLYREIVPLNSDSVN
jgi:hypothetical protein